MLQLQRNVSPPIRSTAAHGNKKYPFESMQVNDFMFVAGKKRNSIRTYFATAGKQYGIKLTSKLTHARQDENGAWSPCEADTPGAVLGVGVWRVA